MTTSLVSSPSEWPHGSADKGLSSRGLCRADLVAFGVRIRLETEAPLWLEALLDRVPCTWIDSKSATPPVNPLPDCRIRWLNTPPCWPHSGLREPSTWPPSRLLVDDHLVVMARQPRHIADRFEHELLIALAARTQWLLLHAGVLVHDRRAILLPGRSFAGKSTLVRALVRAGAVYYSDDLAAVDAAGRVHAVPRRLAIRRTPTDVTHVDASHLGWTPCCPPRPIKNTLLTRYRPGASFAPRRLSPGRGALALFGHALSAASTPEQTFRAVVALASRVPVYATDRGEAEVTAAAILNDWSQP